MKQLKNVFSFELLEMIKRKTVVLSTIIIAVLVFALTFVPSVLSGGSSDVSEESDTQDYQVNLNVGVLYDASLENEIASIFSSIDGVVFLENLEDVKDALDEGEIGSAFKLETLQQYTFYTNDQDVYSNDKAIFEDLLRSYIIDQRLKDKGIEPSVVYTAMDVTFDSEEIVMGKSASNGMFIAFAMLFVMYMLILLYGQSVATSVAREKDSRTMELLITSTKPSTLILGKVFAVGLMGVLQISFILFALYVGFTINKGNYPAYLVALIGGALNFKTAVVYSLFSVSGYILYLFIYAALGSLVSKLEDVNSVVQPITIVFFVAYMIATFAMNMPNSNFVKFSSYVPFVSMFTMPIRNMLTTVSNIEIIGSLIIMVVTTGIMAAASVYIYRFGSLNYGNKMKLKHVIKSLKK